MIKRYLVFMIGLFIAYRTQKKFFLDTETFRNEKNGQRDFR